MILNSLMITALVRAIRNPKRKQASRHSKPEQLLSGHSCNGLQESRPRLECAKLASAFVDPRLAIDDSLRLRLWRAGVAVMGVIVLCNITAANPVIDKADALEQKGHFKEAAMLLQNAIQKQPADSPERK